MIAVLGEMVGRWRREGTTAYTYTRKSSKCSHCTLEKREESVVNLGTGQSDANAGRA